MSHVSSPAHDFDFWEAISCSKCHLPFISDFNPSPLVPFWLTECGHIICNSHLNVDQSCACCGAQSTQMVPLQREMDPPMSDWFRSLPHAIDSIAQTAKFQQETMASLLAFYKRKCQKQRDLIERMKADVMEAKSLRITVQGLQVENEQFRQYIEYNPQDGFAEVLNKNGKRRMLDAHRGSRTNSSPRTIVTPLRPDRLTLPPDHQEPDLKSPRADDDPSFQVNTHSAHERPGSRLFNQQYAYTTQQSSRLPQQTVLSHEQIAPTRRPNHTTSQQDQIYDLSTDGKPSTTHMHARKFASTLINRQDQNRRTMAPPPTPMGGSQPQAVPLPSSSRHFAPGLPTVASRRFTAPVQHPSKAFLPSTPVIAPSTQRFVATSSRPTPRASNTISRSESQRTPFVASRTQDSFK